MLLATFTMSFKTRRGEKKLLKRKGEKPRERKTLLWSYSCGKMGKIFGQGNKRKPLNPGSFLEKST